ILARRRGGQRGRCPSLALEGRLPEGPERSRRARRPLCGWSANGWGGTQASSRAVGETPSTASAGFRLPPWAYCARPSSNLFRKRPMTHRELFREIMFYGKFDRTPVVHWAGWPETRTRWLAEGLPADADERKFLNATAHWTFVGVNVDLWPHFPEETIEETNEYRVFRAWDGVIQKAWKNKSSIPHY